jgi:Sec-independent protein secretion pathway component TatC
MAQYDHDQPAPTLTPQEARQGKPQGFVRTIMYVSIALALIGMFIAYVVISP